MIKMKGLINCFMAGGILVLISCSSMSKTQKGVVIGAAGGGAAGAAIGHAAGNTGLGAIIGATVGGVAGGIIGHHMDKQAEEIKKANADAKVERVGEGIVVEFKDKVLFGYDQSSLGTDAMASLDKVAVILKKYGKTDIQVQGHTDNSGSQEYNQTLSEKRAGSVNAYLVQQGIAAARLTSKGLGETSPKYRNDTEDGKAGNRRVEFLITANEAMKAEAKKEAAAKG